jgi:hypothetical protein
MCNGRSRMRNEMVSGENKRPKSETRLSLFNRKTAHYLHIVFSYITPILNMSTAYADVAACARRIIEMVGSCDDTEARLTLSGRSPNFPVVSMEVLLARLPYERLEASKKNQISTVLRKSLLSLRDRFTDQYWRDAKSLYSPINSGISDVEVEQALIQMYETRYSHCLDSIRTLLSRFLARGVDSITDSRNTRGGFGDVSPFHHLC